MAIALTSNNVQLSLSSSNTALPLQTAKVATKDSQVLQLKSNSVKDVVSLSNEGGEINRAAAGISVVASSYTSKGLPANNTATNVESKTNSDVVAELKSLKESGVSQSQASTKGSVIDNVSSSAVAQTDVAERNRQVNNQLTEQKVAEKTEQKVVEKKTDQTEQSKAKVEAKRTSRVETAQQEQHQERTDTNKNIDSSEKISNAYKTEQNFTSKKIDVKA